MAGIKGGIALIISGGLMLGALAGAPAWAEQAGPKVGIEAIDSKDSPVVEIIENQKALDILIQHVPDMARLAKEGRKPNPSMTLRGLANSMFVSISDEQLEAIDKELGKL